MKTLLKAQQEFQDDAKKRTSYALWDVGGPALDTVELVVDVQLCYPAFNTGITQ